jgi:hypothetical protein
MRSPFEGCLVCLTVRATLPVPDPGLAPVVRGGSPLAFFIYETEIDIPTSCVNEHQHLLLVIAVYKLAQIVYCPNIQMQTYQEAAKENDVLELTPPSTVSAKISKSNLRAWADRPRKQGVNYQT